MQFGSCMTIVDDAQADVANDPIYALAVAEQVDV
jgi:hypothetical protein